MARSKTRTPRTPQTSRTKFNIYKFPKIFDAVQFGAPGALPESITDTVILL